ncbi:hypothetical protein SD70_09880 [Gordoniibacillus kamchatkensis]|uniref:Uncharacterized protein n=1 Tax=Gordoniibacillus kamchatkensis TaxID=1590651 RepID=A0ABR5AJC8_9BACL|nr:hypothetical protein [Paenibacillus sp. VKM B-2647]KIL40943.1 hypothetical protein SD70_09880 [Paenibacillus sp. VKM B-2647]
MDYNKLVRYCDLKLRHKEIEEELEELRKEIVAMYQDSSDIKINDYTLKIVYQDKKSYDNQKVFDSLPDPELWKNVSKVDGAKITALIKAEILSEAMLEGTYTVSKVPYLYVHKS